MREPIKSPLAHLYDPDEPRWVEFDPYPDTGVWGWIKRIRRPRVEARKEAWLAGRR